VAGTADALQVGSIIGSTILKGENVINLNRSRYARRRGLQARPAQWLLAEHQFPFLRPRVAATIAEARCSAGVHAERAHALTVEPA